MARDIGPKAVRPQGRLIVEITEDDARLGKKACPKGCVLQRAIHRTLGTIAPGALFQVGHQRTKVKNDGILTVFRTPPELRPALKQFDSTGVWDVAPGFYVFEPLPQPKPRTAAKKEQQRLYDEKRGAKRGKTKDFRPLVQKRRFTI